MFGLPTVVATNSTTRSVIPGVTNGWNNPMHTHYSVTSFSPMQFAVLDPSLLSFHHSGGCLQKGGGGRNDDDREFERVEHVLSQAVGAAERTIIHAIENEVDCMFPHQLVSKKERRQTSDKKAEPTRVRVHPVSLNLDIHLGNKEGHPYPYDLKAALDKEREEHNIKHVVIGAEKALVHAIEEEVDTLFLNLHSNRLSNHESKHLGD